MSRAFTLGILIVLLGLLGVMSYAVRSATQTEQPKPSPEQQKAMEKQQAEQQKEMMRKEVEQRKKMMADMKKHAEEAKKHPKSAASTGIQIESGWFNKRPSGEAGIKVTEKAAEALANNKATPILYRTTPAPEAPVQDNSSKTPAVSK